MSYSKNGFHVLMLKNEPQPADLVLFTEFNKSVYHVGIIISESIFNHAQGRKKPVRVDNFENAPYWEDRLIGEKKMYVNLF